MQRIGAGITKLWHGVDGSLPKGARPLNRTAHCSSNTGAKIHDLQAGEARNDNAWRDRDLPGNSSSRGGLTAREGTRRSPFPFRYSECGSGGRAGSRREEIVFDGFHAADAAGTSGIGLAASRPGAVAPPPQDDELLARLPRDRRLGASPRIQSLNPTDCQRLSSATLAMLRWGGLFPVPF